MRLAQIKKIVFYGIIPLISISLIVFGSTVYKFAGALIALSGGAIYIRLRSRDEDRSELPTLVTSQKSSDLDESVKVIRTTPTKDIPQEKTEKIIPEAAAEEIIAPANVVSAEQVLEEKEGIEIITDDNYYPPVAQRHRELTSTQLKDKYDTIALAEIDDSENKWSILPYILESFLRVVYESLDAYSVILFWYKEKREVLEIEKYLTNSNDIEQKVFNLENDILSKIVLNREPQLQRDVNPAAESDIIRYYKTPQGIKSFIGVPIYYNNAVIGIIAVDSKESDAFGVETVQFLARIISLISFNIQLIDQKVAQSRLEDQKRALSVFSRLLIESGNESEFIERLGEIFYGCINFDAFVYVKYSFAERKFFVDKVFSTSGDYPFAKEGDEVDLNSTILGKTIYQNRAVKIDELIQGKHRRFNSEELSAQSGSFLAVPLVYGETKIGTLCFESKRKSNFQKDDAIFVASLGYIVSYVVYSNYQYQYLRQYVTLDPETNLLNPANFKLRLEHDIMVASTAKFECSFALFKIDSPTSTGNFFEVNQNSTATPLVVRILQKDGDKFNSIGKLDDNLFGVLFLKKSLQEGNIWAEKVRKEITRASAQEITGDNNVTVSVGIVDVPSNANVEKLLEGAHITLKKAIDEGGNRVKLAHPGV